MKDTRRNHEYLFPKPVIDCRDKSSLHPRWDDTPEERERKAELYMALEIETIIQAVKSGEIQGEYVEF